MELKNLVRLLVVDEEPNYFAQLREYAELCRHEFQIECKFADSKERLEEVIKQWSPSVVILDLYAIGIPCFEVLEGCRGRSIPVIATCPAYSHEIEHSALSHGAVAYRPKSDDPEELEQTLHLVANVSELNSCCN